MGQEPSPRGSNESPRSIPAFQNTQLYGDRLKKEQCRASVPRGLQKPSWGRPEDESLPRSDGLLGPGANATCVHTHTHACALMQHMARAPPDLSSVPTRARSCRVDSHTVGE